MRMHAAKSGRGISLTYVAWKAYRLPQALLPDSDALSSYPPVQLLFLKRPHHLSGHDQYLIATLGNAPASIAANDEVVRIQPPCRGDLLVSDGKVKRLRVRLDPDHLRTLDHLRPLTPDALLQRHFPVTRETVEDNGSYSVCLWIKL